jgi:hypothetical protein
LPPAGEHAAGRVSLPSLVHAVTDAYLALGIGERGHRALIPTSRSASVSAVLVAAGPAPGPAPSASIPPELRGPPRERAPSPTKDKAALPSSGRAKKLPLKNIFARESIGRGNLWRRGEVNVIPNAIADGCAWRSPARPYPMPQRRARDRGQTKRAHAVPLTVAVALAVGGSLALASASAPRALGGVHTDSREQDRPTRRAVPALGCLAEAIPSAQPARALGRGFIGDSCDAVPPHHHDLHSHLRYGEHAKSIGRLCARCPSVPASAAPPPLPGGDGDGSDNGEADDEEQQGFAAPLRNGNSRALSSCLWLRGGTPQRQPQADNTTKPMSWHKWWTHDEWWERLPARNSNPVTLWWRIKQKGPYTKWGLNHMNPICKIIAFQMSEMLHLQTLALMGQVNPKLTLDPSNIQT